MLPLSDPSYQFPSVFPGIWTSPQPPAAKKPITDKVKVKSKLSASTAAFVPVSEASPQAGPLSAPPFAARSTGPVVQAHPSAAPFAALFARSTQSPSTSRSDLSATRPGARPDCGSRHGTGARSYTRGASFRSGPGSGAGLEDRHTIGVPKMHPKAKEALLKIPGWAETVSLIEAGRVFPSEEPAPLRRPYQVTKVETLAETLARKGIDLKSFLGANQILEKFFPKEISDANKITFSDIPDGPSTEEDSTLTDESFEAAIGEKSGEIPTVAHFFAAMSLKTPYPPVLSESTERKESKSSKALDDDELAREVLHITSQQELHPSVMEDIIRSWSNLTRPLRKAWKEFLKEKPGISRENFDPCFELEEHQKIWDAYIAFLDFVYPGDFGEGATTLPSNLNPFSYKIIDTSKSKPTIKEIREID